MKTPKSYCQDLLRKIETDERSLVWLALLLELLLVSYLAFLALFTLEMLLPGFVSTKISLVKFLSVLVLCSFAALGLARVLQVRFPSALPCRKSLGIATGLWFAGIMLLAFLEFPLWTVPLLVVSQLIILYLFARLFFSDESGGS